MIGAQPTGAIDGVVITAVSHEGLRVVVDGKPARLAIVLDDGTIVAAGAAVAREALNVAVNCYRNVLKGEGFLRVYSGPISKDSEV
ncbi:hypothetical protein [Variovorax sp. Sphag1AA]|uniref:hypothetical protein n=1 Tax=Variovorax sp. Sphag1AA TaxID=2587027 RepID=UPI00160A9A93|nr:hypothetical protein [Variovorax sp. Sphag1AA]MBB3179736.1 hypothetical protein [Variovorax sp. Sphag1AA]